MLSPKPSLKPPPEANAPELSPEAASAIGCQALCSSVGRLWSLRYFRPGPLDKTFT